MFLCVNALWLKIPECNCARLVAQIQKVMLGIERPLMNGHVSEGRIDLTKFRNITSLPTTRLIPRASLLIPQQQAQHLQQNYRTNLKIDFEHGAADHEKNGNGSSSGNSVTVGGYEKLSTASGLSGAGGALSGGGSREVPSVTYEQVDKSIKMSLEPKTSLDSLTNAYGSLKNGRGDQKSEMIIVTPSLVAQSHDREMVSVPDLIL